MLKVGLLRDMALYKKEKNTKKNQFGSAYFLFLNTKFFVVLFSFSFFFYICILLKIHFYSCNVKLKQVFLVSKVKGKFKLFKFRLEISSSLKLYLLKYHYFRGQYILARFSFKGYYFSVSSWVSSGSNAIFFFTLADSRSCFRSNQESASCTLLQQLDALLKQKVSLSSLCKQQLVKTG